jgi:peptidoglycan hydrolase CwlO-like protein
MINLLLSKYKAYIYLGAFIAVCSVCFGAGVGFNKLTSDHVIAKLKLKHQEEIYDREQTLMEIERQANEELKRKQDQIDEANTQFAEEMKNAKAKIDQLTACIKSGDCVYKPKVKACVSTSKTDNTGATVTETRAELDSETARSLVGITSRCDEITLQLNALIDAVQ